MPFPHLQNPLRLILWFTALGAAIGVVYSRSIAMSEGSPLFSFDGVLRGLLTGTVISSILISFETFVLAGPIGAPLQRAPFTVHVAVKSIVYLVVILFGLALGAWAFPIRTATCWAWASAISSATAHLSTADSRITSRPSTPA